MNSVQTQKKALRKVIREKTRGLDEAYLRDSDSSIQARLLALPEWKMAGTLFIYISIGKEPDTLSMIRAALAQGKRVGVPRCLEGGIMEAREITSLDGLTPSRLGILEPDGDHPLIPPGALELVVAPCVAVDRQCHRLGNGGGYYDRYLPQVNCPVVCLCRGELVLEEIPTDARDAPVCMVVTERGVYGCVERA